MYYDPFVDLNLKKREWRDSWHKGTSGPSFHEDIPGPLIRLGNIIDHCNLIPEGTREGHKNSLCEVLRSRDSMGEGAVSGNGNVPVCLIRFTDTKIHRVFYNVQGSFVGIDHECRKICLMSRRDLMKDITDELKRSSGMSNRVINTPKIQKRIHDKAHHKLHAHMFVDERSLMYGPEPETPSEIQRISDSIHGDLDEIDRIIREE